MKYYLTTLVLLFTITIYSQIGIGTITPNQSTILDITSTDRGVLLPRIALTGSTDTTTIVNGNVIGLLIYNTASNADVVPGFYSWNGLQWQRFATSTEVPSVRGIEMITTTNGTFFSSPGGYLKWSSNDPNTPSLNPTTNIVAPFGSTTSNITIIPSTSPTLSDKFKCSKNIISLKVYVTIQINAINNAGSPGVSPGGWRSQLFLNGFLSGSQNYWGTTATGLNNERCTSVFEFGPIAKDTEIGVEIEPFNLPAGIQNANSYFIIEYESEQNTIPTIVSPPTTPQTPTNYYVSTTGNNNNVGTTPANAWQTIQYAVDNINNGDTIIVLDGDYFENIEITESGAAGGVKTLKSQNQYGAKLINTADYYKDGIKVTCNYWNINGFEIYHSNLNDIAYGHGIFVLGGNHIAISNNKIHDCGGSGIQYGAFDYATVKNNIVYNTSYYNTYQTSGISLFQARAFDNLPGYHNIIQSNTSYNNININTFANGQTTDGNGIIIDDFRNTQYPFFNVSYAHATLVDNNLCYGNGGKGLHIFYSNNVSLFNNTAYNNSLDVKNLGWRAELCNAFSENCIWRNNIGYAIIGNGILSNNIALMVGYAETITFENNLTFNGTAGNNSTLFDNTPFSDASFSSNNLLGVNPLFINPSLSNFQLQPSSPALNYGSNLIESFFDINNNPRILNSIDIGCFEQ